MNTSHWLSPYWNVLLPKVPGSYQSEFRFHRFSQNNRRIFILSLFLVFEQSAYGLFVSAPGTLLRQIYFLSAGLMLVTALSAFHFRRNPPGKPGLGHRIFEYSLAIIGMSVALLRTLILEAEVFRIPTIYIAVVYALAVMFFFHYRVSFVLYLIFSLSTAILVPHFHPMIRSSSYIADIASNGAIAWLISTITYRSFVKDFLKTKTIEDQRDQIEKANRELEEQSLRDELTSLYNRRKLDAVLKEVSGRAARYGSHFALIIMDVDHFKRINDNHGHHTGDRILREIGKILCNNIREVDTCGRWGGEEFLVICPETDLHHARLLAERLRILIMEAYERPKPIVTASFGVATSEETQKLDTVLTLADDRLYQAKELGRNRVVAGELTRP